MRTARAFQQIRREQVTKVYSGRPGCACGCRGKYTVPTERMTPENPLTPRQAAAINGQVTRVLKVINAALCPNVHVDCLEVSDGNCILDDGRWVSVENEGHVYTVYYRPR